MLCLEKGGRVTTVRQGGKRNRVELIGTVEDGVGGGTLGRFRRAVHVTIRCFTLTRSLLEDMNVTRVTVDDTNGDSIGFWVRLTSYSNHLFGKGQRTLPQEIAKQKDVYDVRTGKIVKSSSVACLVLIKIHPHDSWDRERQANNGDALSPSTDD